MGRFSLIDEGWLPLRSVSSGEVRSVGIAQALLESDTFGDLVVDLPTQVPALLRQVLLPIVVDSLGGPGDRLDWARRFAQGAFSSEERERLGRYVDEHRLRFDLFHPERPFAQVASLHTVKNETKGSALMVATAATGNNVPLFSSRTEADPLSLTPAQAARWLLHTHCWDTAAIKTGVVGDPKAKVGKTTGNPTGPLGQLGVVMPIGATLYETLLLNIPIGVQQRLGSPQWKRKIDQQWDIREAEGLLDLWTWQARRIRLFPEQTDDGWRVTRVIVAAGDRLGSLPDWEPHTAWKVEKTPKRTKRGAPAPPMRPLRHTPGKAIWRGLDALLAVSADDNSTFRASELLDQLSGLTAIDLIDARYPLRAETFGMLYGNQSAVVEDVVHDLMPVPIAALRADTDVHRFVLDAAGQADQLAQAVNRLSDDLRRAAGLDPIPWDKAQRPGEQLLHALDPVMRRMLHGLQRTTDPELIDRAPEAWESTACREALRSSERVYGTVSESVFAGRERHGPNGVTIPAFPLGRAFQTFYSRLDSVLPSAVKERYKGTSPSYPRSSEMRRRYWDRIDDDGRWLDKDPDGGRLFGPPPGEDLAVMRAGLKLGAAEHWEMCRFYTFNVDDNKAKFGQVSPEQEAEHGALALYGVHQQSKRTSMHRPGIGLGVALRRLRNHEKFSSEAVDAKVSAAATTTDVAALLMRLTGLIELLRVVEVPLDYGHLMWLIRDWAHEDRRRRARRRWALEYQVWNQQPGESPGNAA